MPVKNKELARKVRDHILAEPLRLNMADIILKKGKDKVGDHLWDRGRENEFPSCNTAACVLGWTQILSDRIIEIPHSSQFRKSAQEILGLTPTEGHHLFFGKWWYSLKYKTSTVEQRAQMAAEKINKLFKLDG